MRKKEYEPKTMMDTPRIRWKSAKDWTIIDDKGKEYIDMCSGIFVTNVGHRNPKFTERIKEQLDVLPFAFAFPTDIREELTNKLISITPEYLDMVALFSEGGVATDKAVQIARKYTGKELILSFKNSYHGSTIFWKDQYSNGLQEEFPFNKRKFNGNKYLPEDIAAVIIEGYRGWDARFFPKSYIKSLQKWCNDNNVLLIVDEIQSGFWRTGKLFAYQHYDINPDLVTIGKAFGGGVPLSGVLGNHKIMTTFDDSELISNTHSGNCISMAGALGNLEAYEDINLDLVRKNGELFKELLFNLKKEYDEIVEITGNGMLWAIHVTTPELATNIVLKCIDNGLMMIITRKHTIKIGPPICISSKDIIKAVDIIKKSIKEVDDYDIKI